MLRFNILPVLKKMVKSKALPDTIPMSERKLRQFVFGINLLEIHVSWLFVLFLSEFITGYSLFQTAAIVIWCLDNYYLYASAILISTIVASFMAAYETNTNQKELHKMSHFVEKVEIRDFKCDQDSYDSRDIVPGDVVVMKCGILPCDMILLTGSCSVNEEMLTGESTSIFKTGIMNGWVQNQSLENHSLKAGTNIIALQTTDQNTLVYGMANKTTWNTARGKLVLSILYPKGDDGFKFKFDALLFVLVMAVLGVCGCISSILFLLRHGLPWTKLVIKVMDVITIAVPPALPIALTMGDASTNNRLRGKLIYSTNSKRVNMCGIIDICCFDKTGTLTHGKEILKFVQPISDNILQGAIMKEFVQKDLPTISTNLLELMIKCQSLTFLSGKAVGDSLEEEIYASTGAEMSTQPTLIKYPFEPTLQRMGVLVEGNDCHYFHSKGAPSMIRSLCSENTIPSNFDEVLLEYERKCYRVLGCAYKKVEKSEEYARIDLESELTFLGFLIFENNLKYSTSNVMSDISKAEINLIMITGDSANTAQEVGKLSGFLKSKDPLTIDDDLTVIDQNFGRRDVEFVVTGRGFNAILDIKSTNRENFEFTLSHAKIYARMRPDQKGRLIEEMKGLNLIVAMVGDGANDCNALKSAHVGLSLSKAEASIAAPFTSSMYSLECVTNLIKEGRASLVTAIQVFKYMASFSIISFFAVLQLYWHNTCFADTQFVWLDLAIVLPLAFLIGLTEPSDELVNKKPQTRLFHPLTFVSLIIQVFLSGGIILAIQYHFSTTSWFVPHDRSQFIYYTMEATITFYITQLILANQAIAFSISSPFKKEIFTNAYLTLYLGIFYLMAFYLTMGPHSWFVWVFELKPIPIFYRIVIFGYGLLHLALTWFAERFIMVWWGRTLMDKITGK